MVPRNRLAGFFKADRIAALVFLVVVVLYGLGSERLSTALQVDVVGPAFFPRILTWLGVTLAVALFFSGSSTNQAEEETEGESSDWTSMAPVAFLLGYVLLLEPLGFPLATAAFLTLVFKYFGYPQWNKALVLAVAITAAIFFLFHFTLEIRLPLGLLGRLA